jgi:hemoglobin
MGQTWRGPGPVCHARAVRPTLFEFAGGEPAFLALAAAHHERCLRDPELNHPFSHPGQHPQHVERLAAYWAEVMGWPPRYSQTCGDQSGLLHMHAGNRDMSDLGRRFVDCFVNAADDAGLPADREFRAALRAYMEWAVEGMLAYPSPDAVVRRAWPCRAGHGTASRPGRPRRDRVRRLVPGTQPSSVPAPEGVIRFAGNPFKFSIPPVIADRKFSCFDVGHDDRPPEIRGAGRSCRHGWDR